MVKRRILTTHKDTYTYMVHSDLTAHMHKNIDF
jgi:hypothetical protein